MNSNNLIKDSVIQDFVKHLEQVMALPGKQVEVKYFENKKPVADDTIKLFVYNEGKVFAVALCSSKVSPK